MNAARHGAQGNGPSSEPASWIGGDDAAGSDPHLAWFQALDTARLWRSTSPQQRRVLGGIRVRASAGPVRDAWLSLLLADEAAVVQAPRHADHDAFDGTLDMDATLRGGRPVRCRGLIERARGGMLVVRGVRDPGAVARLCRALDLGEIALVLLDDGDGDEVVPPALTSRLALSVNLDAIGWLDVTDEPFVVDKAFAAENTHGHSAKAANARPSDAAVREEAPIRVGNDVLSALDSVASAAAPHAALRRLLQMHALACLLAKQRGATETTPLDALDAVRLCLGISAATKNEAREERHALDADRANEHHADAAATPNDPPPDAPAASSPEAPNAETSRERQSDERDHTSGTSADQRAPTANPSEEPRPVTRPEDTTSEAADMVLPPGLLEAARDHAARERSGPSPAAQGQNAKQQSAARGAPAGTVSRPPQRGTPLSLFATLRAAAPWQGVRGRSPGERLRVCASDFRYKRRRAPLGTTVLFGVDASGSAANERLSEAKGAVESLLAEAYVRRDVVGLVAFRGGRADELLPPSKGLVRAKRALGAMPGGGGTPLAAGLSALGASSVRELRSGRRVMLVLLTDGRGNVALDGRTGRGAARDDEERTALALRRLGVPVLVIDTAARPGRHALALAERLNGRHIILPRHSRSEERGMALGRLIESELAERSGRSGQTPERRVGSKIGSRVA